MLNLVTKLRAFATVAVLGAGATVPHTDSIEATAVRADRSQVSPTVEPQNSYSETPLPRPSYALRRYELEAVPVNEHLFEIGVGQAPTTNIENADANNVVRINVGGTLYYNPVTLSDYGIKWCVSYINAGTAGDTTRQQEYLTLIGAYRDALWALVDEVDGAAYFRYEWEFNIPLIGDYDAPWYSGMAQGLALGFFARAYDITKDKQYLEKGDKVMRSFSRLQNDGAVPWTSDVDENGYYWPEEFPHENGKGYRVLNGHLFAAAGLYDWWRITGEESARMYVWASLETARHYLGDFYVPRGYSSYTLMGAGTPGSAHYHNIHVKQLEFFAALTGEAWLRLAACIFKHHALSASVLEEVAEASGLAHLPTLPVGCK